MHPSLSQPVHWHVGGHVGQFVAALASVLFVNPFGLIVAVIGAWFLALASGSMARLIAEGAGWAALACGACMLGLTLITALAACHLLITAIAGWSGARRR